MSAPSATPSAALAPRQFAAIAAIMQAEARIHLAPSKVTLIESRLARRVREHGLASFADYVALVESDPAERGEMVASLTTNHTHFFREAHHFDHVRDTLSPALRERAARRERVRLWSAGCSSGEEVYTLAMVLLGHGRSAAKWALEGDVRLLASDLSPPVVAAVACGEYADSVIEPVPPAYRDRWLERSGSGWRVRDELRALVTPRVLNLFGDWPMRGNFDAIFCRNVMIYFEKPAQAELQQRLAAQLRPGGFLYIGHSERLMGPAEALFERCGQTIYRKRAGAA